MLRYLFAAACTIHSILLSAQPVITQAENWKAGALLKFRYASFSGQTPGPGGPGQVWDYSGLMPAFDTFLQAVRTNPLPGNSPFPSADLVMIGSDSSYQYIKSNSSFTYLLGVDGQGSRPANYDSVLWAVRPVTYGSLITDSFHVSYPGIIATDGRGIVIIQGDGYGSLMLPTGLFNNVLRIKIEQFERDTTIAIGTSAVFNKTSYCWYDNAHTAPLLRIDSIYTTQGFQPHILLSIQYLQMETTTGIPDPHQGHPIFSAGFSHNTLVIGGLSAGKKYELSLCNIAGQELYRNTRVPDASVSRFDTWNELPAGMYLVTLIEYQTGFVQHIKVVKGE